MFKMVLSVAKKFASRRWVNFKSNLSNNKPREFYFNQDFQYGSTNPYHHRLAQFSSFCLRDSEAEQFCGEWHKHFTNDYPLHLEIGSGYGHFMQEMCRRKENVNFIGMDYRFKRSYQVVKRLCIQDINNFRYLRAKAERLNFIFAPNEIETIYYFFPDPWPKNRHRKKRLFTPYFLNILYQVLRSTGRIFIKTDQDDLFCWIKKQLSQVDNLFETVFESRDLWQEESCFLTSFKTKFEDLFLGQGLTINALILQSKKNGGKKSVD